MDRNRSGYFDMKPCERNLQTRISEVPFQLTNLLQAFSNVESDE